MKLVNQIINFISSLFNSIYAVVFFALNMITLPSIIQELSSTPEFQAPDASTILNFIEIIITTCLFIIIFIVSCVYITRTNKKSDVIVQNIVLIFLNFIILVFSAILSNIPLLVCCIVAIALCVVALYFKPNKNVDNTKTNNEASNNQNQT